MGAVVTRAILGANDTSVRYLGYMRTLGIRQHPVFCQTV